MLSLSDIKTGKNILWNGEPYAVLSHEHSKMGRAGAVLRTKLKNLKTGAVLDKTFQGSDKTEEADISKSAAQFLYRDGDEFFFMDNGSFEQFSLSADAVGSATQFLLEGTEVTVINFDDTPINIELPIKIAFTVAEAPPGLKGDTASGGDKVVTIETGAKITTPLFVKAGDKIVINTQTGSYVSRAS